MKLKINQLKRIIKEVIDGSDEIIGNSLLDELEKVAPQAISAILSPKRNSKSRLRGSTLNPEKEDLDMLWVMRSRPEPIEEDEDTGEVMEYSETNEPELGEWLHDEWSDHAIDGSVYLCGSNDDEYGYFWSNKEQVWINYAF